MKRVWLLAVVLSVVLGAGAVAQSPSPVTPDDDALSLPQAVGDSELVVLWEDFSISSDLEAGYWSDLLARLGKDVTDLRAAGGFVLPATGYDEDDVPFVIAAYRITGIPARDWAASFGQEMVTAFGESQAASAAGWRVIDGRDIYAVTPTPATLAMLRTVDREWYVPDDTGHWFYPVGEVLYWVSVPFDWPVPPPTITEALAALP